MSSMDIVVQHIVEAKVHSRTDIFSDARLQKSKHGNNCAKSSEQQDMQTLGVFSIPETLVVQNHI